MLKQKIMKLNAQKHKGVRDVEFENDVKQRVGGSFGTFQRKLLEMKDKIAEMVCKAKRKSTHSLKGNSQNFFFAL